MIHSKPISLLTLIPHQNDFFLPKQPIQNQKSLNFLERHRIILSDERYKNLGAYPSQMLRSQFQ